MEINESLNISNEFFSLGFRKKKIKPEPRQIALTKDCIIKFKLLKGNPRNGAVRLTSRKVIAPILPLFSTLVYSAKKANTEGIPRPNDIPKRQHVIKTGIIVELFRKTGNIETMTPKIVHELINRNLLIFFDKFEPIKLEINSDK